MDIYTVRPGDTLSEISRRYGVSVNRLASDNGLSAGSRLAAGQALLVLEPETVHTFASGDTLFSVAAEYGTTVMQLYRNNPALIGLPYIPAGTQITVAFDSVPTESIGTSGFVYDYIEEETLLKALPYLTYVIIFGYGFEEDGSLIEREDSRIIDTAHNCGTAVLLSLTAINRDGSFSSAKAARLLTDNGLRDTVMAKMLETVRRKGAQGIDIDMEYLPAELKNEFAAFVSNTEKQFGAEGLVTHADLAPKNSSSQTGVLYEAHDYRLIGEASDKVFLMTYEWGYKYSEPRAIAPLPEVRGVLEYALTEIPKEKIFLGIPNYGYDWKLPYVKGKTAAAVLGNAAAVKLAAETGSEIFFDEISQSPYFYYTDSSGAEREVWFEDVRSINAKLDLVMRSGIGGCGWWNLMRPFPANFLLLGSRFNIIRRYAE